MHPKTALLNRLDFGLQGCVNVLVGPGREQPECFRPAVGVQQVTNPRLALLVSQTGIAGGVAIDGDEQTAGTERRTNSSVEPAFGFLGSNVVQR